MEDFLLTISFIGILFLLKWFMDYLRKSSEIQSDYILSSDSKANHRCAADDNEWGQMFLQTFHELSEQEKLKEQIAEDFKRAQGELAKMQNLYEKYFDGYNELHTIMLPSDFALEPLKRAKMHIDYTALKKLKNDSDTAQSMPKFCGEGSEDYIYEYLINTCMSTEMGIAFAYAIRTCKDSQLIENADRCHGIIKVTCPSHNKVTNNFNGWLVDYVMLPEKRNQGLMKLALKGVLKEVNRLGAKKIFAMVMPNNIPSLHVLQHNGFKYAGFGGVDRATGKHSMLLVHEFETTD